MWQTLFVFVQDIQGKEERAVMLSGGAAVGAQATMWPSPSSRYPEWTVPAFGPSKNKKRWDPPHTYTHRNKTDEISLLF